MCNTNSADVGVHTGCHNSPLGATCCIIHVDDATAAMMPQTHKNLTYNLWCTRTCSTISVHRMSTGLHTAMHCQLVCRTAEQKAQHTNAQTRHSKAPAGKSTFSWDMPSSQPRTVRLQLPGAHLATRYDAHTASTNSSSACNHSTLVATVVICMTMAPLLQHRKAMVACCNQVLTYPHLLFSTQRHRYHCAQP
jgi:hypothetical protein